MRLRVALGALVIAAAIGIVAPVHVHADAGGPMTAIDGVFTGTSGDDLLVIGHDGDLLSHNRFAAGDAGFASATDFDSSVDGVQTKAADGQRLSFALAEGSDTVQLVGTLPMPFYAGDFGAGTDTLDATNYSSGPSAGISLNYGNGTILSTVEVVLGSAFNDYVSMANVNAGAITMHLGDGNDFAWGTAGNDVLDGGAGDNELHGTNGNDTFDVATPLPPTRRTIDAYDGGDTFILRGGAGVDHLGFVVVPNDSGPQITAIETANPDGGYVAPYGMANVRVELGGGSDSLVLDAVAPTTVHGGAGSDEIAVNAHEATAAVTNDADDKIVTLPAFLYFADGGPTALRLAGTEKLNVFNETVIATAPGAGGGPHVRTFRADGTAAASFFAYAPSFTGGVSVALGDLDGDFDDEIVTGAGPGGGPHVRVFRSDGTDAGVGFFAYAPDFHGGVNVAAIDLDGDDVDEIVTVPAQGGGPHVRIWSGDGELLDEFMAEGFGNTGLRVAAGSTLTEAGRTMLLSAASGPSLVAVFGGNAADLVPYPGFGGGAAVAGAEIDAGAPRGRNGYHDEIVTAAGPGGGPHVKVFESSMSSDNDDYTVLASFYAYDPNFHGGVDVAVCNPDGLDDEIVTAPGAGGGPHVRMFSGKTGAPLALSFMAYDPNFHGGVRVACGGAETRAF